MTCAGCASHVEKALLGAPGVQKVDVSYPEGTARVSGEGPLNPAALSAALHAAGYGLALEKSAHVGGFPQKGGAAKHRTEHLGETNGARRCGWPSSAAEEQPWRRRCALPRAGPGSPSS